MREKLKSIGNIVMIPKLNDEFIAIHIQNTMLVKIYDIKKQKYVRQFLMEKGEDFFDVKQEGGGAGSGCSSSEGDADSLDSSRKGKKKPHTK